MFKRSRLTTLSFHRTRTGRASSGNREPKPRDIGAQWLDSGSTAVRQRRRQRRL